MLDHRNPRIPDQAFARQDDVLEYLVGFGALEELVQSISLSGWIDVEPLIVLRDTNEVIEGNRRLAALRLIEDPDLAKRFGIKVPAPLHEKAQPDKVRAWLVDDRKQARDFIGFKHINGPFKWDSFAKAKYAAEWLQDDPDVLAVAKRLGDTHRTVARLVNGYRVLRQAEKLGFDRTNIRGRFAFSHLYTALTRPAYRGFLGLEDSTELLPENPIDGDHHGDLMQLMLWLYGQDDVAPAIRSQNPDLKRLADILPNKTAVAMLLHEPDLNAAHAVVEDKSQLFADAIFALNTAASRAAALIGNYDGDDEDLEQIVATIMRTVRAIQGSMQSQRQQDSDS